MVRANPCAITLSLITCINSIYITCKAIRNWTIQTSVRTSHTWVISIVIKTLYAIAIRHSFWISGKSSILFFFFLHKIIINNFFFFFWNKKVNNKILLKNFIFILILCKLNIIVKNHTFNIYSSTLDNLHFRPNKNHLHIADRLEQLYAISSMSSNYIHLYM
jgi:hypothetical protein